MACKNLVSLETRKCRFIGREWLLQGSRWDQDSRPVRGQGSRPVWGQGSLPVRGRGSRPVLGQDSWAGFF